MRSPTELCEVWESRLVGLLSDSYPPPSAITLACAHSEAFATEILYEYMADLHPMPLAPSAPIFEKYTKGMSNTWATRAATFKELLGVPLSQIRKDTRMDSLIEIRNCLAHGAGFTGGLPRGDAATSLATQKSWRVDLGVLVSPSGLRYSQDSSHRALIIAKNFNRELRDATNAALTRPQA